MDWRQLMVPPSQEAMPQIRELWRRQTQTSTALHAAARQNDVAAITSYIAGGGDLNIRDNKDSTALSVAASLGNTNAARILLEAGADPNIQDYMGEPALAKAAARGAEDIADMLIGNGANLELALPQRNKTPLIMAASCKRTNVARKLLMAGANVNARSGDGRTALMWALSTTNRPMAMVILDYEPDVNVSDIQGSQTPLNTAVRIACEDASWVDVCKRILDLGAELDTTDEDGKTPLTWAKMFRHEVLIGLLVDRGAEMEGSRMSTQNIHC